MNITKLSKRGQIVIPKKIREMTDFRAGDNIKFSIKNNKIILEKIDPVEDISIIEHLQKGEPFKKNLVKELRDEWE